MVMPLMISRLTSLTATVMREHDIAMTHNVNMAEGKCPVGHDGFDLRSQKVSFFKRSFAENVAYNYGQADAV